MVGSAPQTPHEKLWIRDLEGKIFEPTEPQRRFLQSPVKHLAFIGGQGAGKTTTGAYWTIRMMLAKSNRRLVCARWGYRELYSTSWDVLIRMVPKETIHSLKSSPQMMELNLKNGSRCEGWNLKNWETYQGLNLDGVWIDEVTEVEDSKAYVQLVSRLRGTFLRYIRCTGTPKGKNWVYQLFVNNPPAGHGWIHAPTRSNFHLPEDYERNLSALYSESERQRFLEAEFNDFEGQVIHNFDDQVHVIPPFDPPRHWPIYRSLDPGYAQDEACCLLLTLDEEGNIYVLDEYYRLGEVIREQCRSIHRMSRGYRVQWTAYDVAAHKKSEETGRTQIDVYREGGLSPMVPCTIRQHRHLATQILEACQVDDARLHPFTGSRGSPRIFFTTNCPNTIREMQTLSWDKNGKLKGDDHAFCALGYFLGLTPGHATIPTSDVEDPAWRLFREGFHDDQTAYYGKQDYMGYERMSR